jgi:hypothetical protein
MGFFLIASLNSSRPPGVHKTPPFHPLHPSPGSDLLTILLMYPPASSPLKCACDACGGQYHYGQVDDGIVMPECLHWIYKECAYEWANSYIDGALILPCGCVLHHKPVKVMEIVNEVLYQYGLYCDGEAKDRECVIM